MNTRGTHTGKSHSEREEYSRAIRRLRTESTIDSVPSDTDTDNTLLTNTPVPITTNRPSPFLMHVSQHFKANWLTYAISILAVILTLLTVNLNREVGVVGERINALERTSQEYKTSVQAIETKFDIKIDRQEVNVQTLNRRIENMEIRAEYDKKYRKK